MDNVLVAVLVCKDAADAAKATVLSVYLQTISKMDNASNVAVSVQAVIRIAAILALMGTIFKQTLVTLVAKQCKDVRPAQAHRIASNPSQLIM